MQALTHAYMDIKIDNYTFTHASFMHVSMHTHIQINMHAWIHTHIQINMHGYVYTHAHTHARTCASTHTYTHNQQIQNFRQVSVRK